MFNRLATATLSFALASAALTGAASAAPIDDGGDGTSSTTDRSAAGETLFGGTVFERPGESYGEAFQRLSKAYGGSLDIVRMFHSGLPRPWSTITSDIGDTPLVVSFNADPGAIVAGRHDQMLSQWFADAPRTRPTYWSYFHEPENDGVSHSQYRAAWRHISSLEDRADNPQLNATLIMMCWTLEKNSGRDWRDYYAGDDVVDVLGFDCYNGGHRKGRYRDPIDMMEDVTALSESLGKPFGIAELGSVVVGADGGTRGRAEWLTEYARVIRENGGLFGTYFDSDVGTDYRLNDDASQAAWRAVIQGT